MDQDALSRISSLLDNEKNEDQAAKFIFDTLSQKELDDTSETSQKLLDTIGCLPRVTFSLIQLVIEKQKIEGWWNFLLQLINRMPPEDGVSQLENAILDLWVSPQDASSYASLGLAWSSLKEEGRARNAYDEAIRLDPHNVQVYIGQGKMEYGLGNYSKAITEYDEALTIEPNNLDALTNKAIALYDGMQYEQAILVLNKMVSLDPNDNWAIHERGRNKTALEQYDQAILDYDRVIELDPGYKWAYANKAYTYREWGRFEESQSAFTKALEIDPDYAWAHNEFGVLLERMGEFEKAISEYDRAIALEPDTKWAYANKASALYSLKRHEEAIQALDQAIRIDPEYTWAIHERGRNKVALEQYEPAILDFDRVIELDPGYKSAYANKAYTYREWGRFAESQAAFIKVLEIDPDYGWAHNEYGMLFERMGEFEKAISEYDRAIALEPDTKWAYANKGSALYSLNRYEEAIQALDQAIRIDPEYTWAIHERGCNNFELERYEQAIPDFDRVIELDPTYKWAFANKGKASEELQRYAEAEKAYQQTLEIDPNYSWVYKQRGELYIKLKEYQKALEDFSQMIDPGETNASSYSDRAQSYLTLGKALGQEGEDDTRQDVLRKARSDLDRALQLAPDNSDNYWYQGSVLWEFYAYDWAAQAYQKAIEQIADKDSPDVALLRWNLGKCIYQEGSITHSPARYPESIEVLKLAANRLAEPLDCASCLGDQGLAQIALKNYTEAREVLVWALQFNPGDAWLLILLGKTDFLSEKLPLAKESFDALVKPANGPNDYTSYAWVGLGLISEKLGNPDQAKQAFQNASSQDGAESVKARIDCSDAFDFFLQPERAVKELQRARELAPENVDIDNLEAWLYADELASPKNLKQALMLAERAVAADSSKVMHNNYLDTLGWVNYKLGNYKQAYKVLAEANAEIPETLEIRHHLDLSEQALKDR